MLIQSKPLTVRSITDFARDEVGLSTEFHYDPHFDAWARNSVLLEYENLAKLYVHTFRRC